MTSDLPIKLLTFSSLYPNEVVPQHGVFVENRLRHLLATGQVRSKVVAPVPWFPFKSKAFGEYGDFARVPKTAVRHGINIEYPRYLVVPKVGMNWTPATMAAAAMPVIKRIIAQGYDFDVLDAHYFYPDGVAAARIAKALGKPVVITARGTDLNLVPQYEKPRAMIQWAASQAAGLVTVCQALKDSLVQLGVEQERVEVLRNGVDLQLFTPPDDREQLRKSLGIKGKTILSVGHLIERKGHHLVIEALQQLPDVKLLIAGQGPELGNLKRLASEKQVADRVKFLGSIPHGQLRDYYGAVDMLVLASSREGWANVLLESMASGTPVVATSIWGTPEVVAAPEAGVLVEKRSAAGLAEGVHRLYANMPDRQTTRQYAEKFSWDETTQGLLKLFRRVVAV
jgi:teichuronic acid biosynthesis glycosyltransferase TuaC